jgi:hypothetical protein
MQLTPDQERLWNIFHPYAAAKEAIARFQGTRFVHYTSAAAAMSILKNKEIWMRKSTCMNDSSEVRHGLECLAKAYNHSAAGQRLKSILDSTFTGLRAEIEQGFNSFSRFILLDTYLTCVSEHRNEEDILGRLSMWRAYGVTTGVAFVMNNAPFLAPNEVLKAYASAVAYCDDNKFAEEFGNVVNNIETEIDFLKQQDRQLIKGYLFRMFAFAAISTKHPGFAEEIEWRILHCPWWEKSVHLQKSIELIHGVPQPVYKIPLKDIPDEVVGIEIPALLDRIIIGPTRDPQPVWEAFKDLLAAAGVEQPHKKVFISEIPLRQ